MKTASEANISSLLYFSAKITLFAPQGIASIIILIFITISGRFSGFKMRNPASGSIMSFRIN